MNESIHDPGFSLLVSIVILLLIPVILVISDTLESWKMDQQKKVLNAQELLKSYIKDMPGVEAITILDNKLYVFVAVKSARHEETLKLIPTKINDFKVIVVQERFNG